ncbi:MAG TPA: hypothetical protein VD902_05215 [Symbiobacteriaceae bacterium]|nr:hypothetical protein [Symbiobacteriaceae bacterium]
MVRRMRIFVLMVLVAGTLLVPARSLAAPPPGPDEEAVLAELFTLGRALTEKQAAIQAGEAEAASMRLRRAEAAAERERLEQQRLERQARLGRRLRFYHENGRVAPLAVLLGATSFSDFLSRMEILQEILAYESRLVRELRSLKAQVAEQERALQAAATELDRLQAALRADEARLREAVAGREAILAGLRERRAAMEERLAALERTFADSALPVLTALGDDLLKIDPAAFAPDELSMSLFPPGAVAVVSSRTLTGLLSGSDALKGLTARVQPGSVSLEGLFHGTDLRIGGQVVVGGPAVLRFEPEQVRVGDFTVPPEAIAGLTGTGHLDIDLGDMLSPFVLTEVTMAEDQLRVRAGFR